LSEEIVEVLQADVIQNLKSVAISRNLSFSDKIILLRIKIESLLKFTFQEESYKGQFIIAFLVLL
jgi:hypothetical protein